jgi:hypothetical protein
VVGGSRLSPGVVAGFLSHPLRIFVGMQRNAIRHRNLHTSRHDATPATDDGQVLPVEHEAHELARVFTLITEEVWQRYARAG